MASCQTLFDARLIAHRSPATQGSAVASLITVQLSNSHLIFSELWPDVGQFATSGAKITTCTRCKRHIVKIEKWLVFQNTLVPTEAV